MKFTIEEHEEHLRNAKKHLEDERKVMGRRQRAFERQERLVAFFERQIEEAKRRGKKGFDTDRFMAKERKEADADY